MAAGHVWLVGNPPTVTPFGPSPPRRLILRSPIGTAITLSPQATWMMIAVDRSYRLMDLTALMAIEVVHDEHVAWAQLAVWRIGPRSR